MITSHNATVHGYRLHYLEAGSGSPVLLLHGFAGAAEDWTQTLEALARAGYRAFAVDALGFGKSDKPWNAPYSLRLSADLYAGLMDVLGLKTFALVGHSMGGKNALATAVLHPQRVSRLVLLDSDGFQQIPVWMQRGGALPFLGELLLRLAARPQMVRAQLRAAFHDPDTFITDELVARGVALLNDREQRHALLALSRNYDATDLGRSGIRARLNELRCPVLIVWGAEDRYFAPNCGAIAQREIPGSQLVLIPNTGHFPQIEASRPFHGLLIGFLSAAPR